MTTDLGHGERSLLSSMATPLDFEPSSTGLSMVIEPASGESMQVIVGKRDPEMEIIPSTSYPSMDIQPVPEEVQQEMLRVLSQ